MDEGMQHLWKEGNYSGKKMNDLDVLCLIVINLCSGQQANVFWHLYHMTC